MYFLKDFLKFLSKDIKLKLENQEQNLQPPRFSRLPLPPVTQDDTVGTSFEVVGKDAIKAILKHSSPGPPPMVLSKKAPTMPRPILTATSPAPAAGVI